MRLKKKFNSSQNPPSIIETRIVINEIETEIVAIELLVVQSFGFDEQSCSTVVLLPGPQQAGK